MSHNTTVVEVLQEWKMVDKVERRIRRQGVGLKTDNIFLSVMH
jgi:hypothetical protein